MDKMKIKSLSWLYFVLGLLILIISNISRNKVSDFMFGFCEGISIVLLIVGFIGIAFNILDYMKLHSRKDI